MTIHSDAASGPRYVEIRRRGVLGYVALSLFLAFNACMLVWVVSYLAEASRLRAQIDSSAGLLGHSIGFTIAMNNLLTIWGVGAVVLGLCTLLTRGRKEWLSVSPTASYAVRPRSRWPLAVGIVALVVVTVVVIGLLRQAHTPDDKSIVALRTRSPALAEAAEKFLLGPLVCSAVYDLATVKPSSLEAQRMVVDQLRYAGVDAKLAQNYVQELSPKLSVQVRGFPKPPSAPGVILADEREACQSVVDSDFEKLRSEVAAAKTR